LVIKTSLYYDARSEKHQIPVFCLFDFCWRHLRLGILRGNYCSRGDSLVPRVFREVTIILNLICGIKYVAALVV
jgi:hypothetical protein